MTTLLHAKEGVQVQTSAETLVWSVDVSGYTSSPASPSVTEVIDTRNGNDVKSTVMPSGSASASGSTVTLPALQSLSVGREYEVHLTFTDGGSNTFEAILQFRCPI